jgi:hypothetical protein
MEILIGVAGLVIAVLLWLFPPEPLRRLFGVKEPDPVNESSNQEKKRDQTEKFKAILEDLETVEDSLNFVPLTWLATDQFPELSRDPSERNCLRGLTLWMTNCFRLLWQSGVTGRGRTGEKGFREII